MSMVVRWCCSRPRPARVVWRRAAAFSCSAVLATAASEPGHRGLAGDLVIEGAYAAPSVAGLRHSAAYVGAIRNDGDLPDRLCGAATPVALGVELQGNVLVGGALHAGEVAGIGLPARSTVSLRHGSDWQLLLVGLRRPLLAGERFELTLHFERAGSCTVQALVRTAQQGARLACGSHGRN